MVIFIHRPEFTGMSEDPAYKEKAWIVIAKHRNGEVCDIEMKYKSGQVKFVEPDQSLDIQAQRPYVSAASEPASSGAGYNFDEADQPF
jgi:replicative DNA helicase